MKYNNLNLGQIEAITNKLGGMDGVKKLLRDELVISEKKWREKDGVISFSLVSDGATGEEWIYRLESELNFKIKSYAKTFLLSKDFKPTRGIVYEVVVLKGVLFSDRERVSKNIRKEAEDRNLCTPNAEVACLIRKNFSDKDLEAMGLSWLVVMHKPIYDGGLPLQLIVDRSRVGSWLQVCIGDDDKNNNDFLSHNGFAFVVPQVPNS